MAHNDIIGSFVSARVQGCRRDPNNTNSRSIFPDMRQGIVIGFDGDKPIILGENQAEYIVGSADKLTIVPDRNLSGSTRNFVAEWRTAQSPKRG